MSPTSMFSNNTTIDPRPDLSTDSDLWQYVLEIAQQADPFPNTPKSIYGLLHGLRCGGASLDLSAQGKLRLDYSALIDGGTWSNRDLRSNWLLPAAGGIKQVFNIVEQRLSGVMSPTALFPAAVGM